MAFLPEADVEAVLLEQLEGLGYARLGEGVAGPDGSAPERESYGEVVLGRRLEGAVGKLNPGIPSEALGDAVRKVVSVEMPGLVEENRRLHRALVEGVDVEFYAEDGTIQGDKVRLIDFEQPDNNDWLVLEQFTVIEGGFKRRPDVVVFVNGLPLAVIELKNPGVESATLESAYQQLQTYKREISALFRTNAVLVISDGSGARIGSLTASWERFMPWRTTDSAEVKGGPEMMVLIEGVFEKGRFLELIRDFVVFGGADKILAGYHQYHAVRCAVEKTISVSDRKVGVIWHTQGSGKSLLMVFYAGKLVRSPELANPTLVLITDRNDLDDQLFGTFSRFRDLIRQTPEQARSREELQQLLRRASGGVIFTTIQKFVPAEGRVCPALTERKNVVVIADEAHRSQYGFRARVRPTGDIGYGFAKYMRDALPNASFIGFTGTPIEASDVNTPAVFGEYIDIYDISRAVEDRATVPIHYVSRLARIELPDEMKPEIDAEIEDLTEDEALAEQDRLKRKWSAVEKLVGAEGRLQMVAADLVRHFEARLQALDGKAMIVCMSRRICVALYDQLVALRPGWHSEDDQAGVIKIVMSGSASDKPEFQPHTGNKARRDLLAKRARDAEDCLGVIIVCDMWLTGFDVPPLHTMYIDKPMRGHGLMQAIARVNRVFRDKPAGLVVDYIGIAQNLQHALGQYSSPNHKYVGIDEEEVVGLMMDKYDVVKSMFHGFAVPGGASPAVGESHLPYHLDFMEGVSTPKQRLVVIVAAVEWILAQQQEAAKDAEGDARKRALRRYQDAVLALSRTFAMAAASDAARNIRDAVGFFQAVRAAMVKSKENAVQSKADKQLAIRQIIDRAIMPMGIVDILAAAGISTPDISVLSEEFLAEVQQLEKKNLALEALRKLLNDEIRSRSRSHVVEGKRFSERLADAIARYHTNAISTVEVIQELINLARDIREARSRGEREGLSAEEMAFYDALAENKSAVEVMGNDSLKVIAQELLNRLRSRITVDWWRRESVRARMRTEVKRILRKHGYPPDLEASAVQTVLMQAEALATELAAHQT